MSSYIKVVFHEDGPLLGKTAIARELPPGEFSSYYKENDLLLQFDDMSLPESNGWRPFLRRQVTPYPEHYGPMEILYPIPDTQNLQITLRFVIIEVNGEWFWKPDGHPWIRDKGPFKSEDEARQNVKDFVDAFIERLDILELLPEKTD
jgi:hypothetical protein